MNNSVWQEKIINYCKKYNLPLFYLSDTLNEPKVVPMIRGKAFEYTALEALRVILSKDIWTVDKPYMNAQIGFHDIDVRVTHKPTSKQIKIECKLAGKGGFKIGRDNGVHILVKCMRSRTLGPGKIKELAPKFGISESVLAVHNDQYLPTDFDVVVTTIANAFYETDPTTGMFEWAPSERGIEFLNSLSGGKKSREELQDFAFNKLYIARSIDLAMTKDSPIKCTRKTCINKKECGFIPNYPIISFDMNTLKPINGWYELEDAEEVFKKFL